MSSSIPITPNAQTGGFCDLGPEEPPEKEFTKAKALLQSLHHGGASKHDGAETDARAGSVYEHMVSVTKYILEYQPVQALDQFETISRLVKREKASGIGGSMLDGGIVEPHEDALARTNEPKHPEARFAENERELFRHPDHIWNKPPQLGDDLLPDFEGNFEEDEEEAAVLPNLCQQLCMVEQSGIGLGREELTRIWLALRFLYRKLGEDVGKLRFWGKIYGMKANYYIVEAEFEAESDPSEAIPGPWDKWHLPKPPKPIREQDTEEFQAMLLDEEAMANLPVEKRVLIKLPKNKYKPPTLYPREPRGRGMNRWDYYISTDLGEGTWVRLPIVKPEHISMARQSVHFFTGDLNAPVGHMPGGLGLFPGLEVHYLRAQIARITSSCHVSPSGIFEVDEEDEPEEGEKPETLMMAEEYEPMEFTEMLDVANWVHHRPFLYPIGRVNWISQKKAISAIKAIMAEEENGEEAAEEDEEEMAEEEEDEEEEPEEGPDLLAPVEEDLTMKPLGGVGHSLEGTGNDFEADSWRVRPSTVLLPVNCAIAVLSSSRWPGAYAMARKETFVNIYVGWGNKFLSASFQPPRLAVLAKEFDDEAIALQETVDPTAQQEEEVRLRKEAKRLAALARAQEAEEEEEEEDEEDED